MLSLIINIIFISIGFLGFKLVGYLGTLLLITDIFIKYFDIRNIKTLIFEVILVSIAGFFWDRSLIWIIMIGIFLFVGTLLFFKIIKSKKENID